ncbi:hypothetical protein KL930_003079 [Ogataea haglerorum]|uniref:Uncharacterized protein n=1 Tax=Ogataea haglerorum TaxID=1937702 RepID=A0ABQ7RHF5_9ASCO|nr:hypothetical protein KL951_003839 [Ogataea haglerorum]KAG7704780.1 hypothetical protein KL914_004171 [Ogataea haglerorum]KAG7739210.1 hypothetical protein KL932_003304 [Ogataea haglerorum]KAG7756327.1 hypothetical protein KL947_003933 [Ogataea haglerorum]KAG7765608.1 hypothetical protein KL946_002665 [Ogataea haglerorum]
MVFARRHHQNLVTSVGNLRTGMLRPIPAKLHQQSYLGQSLVMTPLMTDLYTDTNLVIRLSHPIRLPLNTLVRVLCLNVMILASLHLN